MFKKIKNAFKKSMDKVLRVYTVIVFSIVFSVSGFSVAYAADPVLVTGTVALFQAITGWLLILIPVVAGCFLGYHAFTKMATDDTAVIAEKNRHMKNVIISAAIAETASGLITVILGFYK